MKARPQAELQKLEDVKDKRQIEIADVAVSFLL